jgi:hypothetical protein
MLMPQRPWLHKELKSSEFMICPLCDGTGGNQEYDEINYIFYTAQQSWGKNDSNIFFVYCPKCGGDGFLDWIENVKGKPEGKDYGLVTDIHFVSVEFLILSLTDKNSDYSYGNFFSDLEGWNFKYKYIDLDEGLRSFMKYKQSVSKFLPDYAFEMFNQEIYITYIAKGKACINCLNLFPDEVLKAPDPNFPLLKICDYCYKNISPSEIMLIKRTVFDNNSPLIFSGEFYKKLDKTDFPKKFI